MVLLVIGALISGAVNEIALRLNWFTYNNEIHDFVYNAQMTLIGFLILPLSTKFTVRVRRGLRSF